VALMTLLPGAAVIGTGSGAARGAAVAAEAGSWRITAAGGMGSIVDECLRRQILRMRLPWAAMHRRQSFKQSTAGHRHPKHTGSQGTTVGACSRARH